MRHIAPWALLVVLLAGVAVGAAVGQVHAPGQTPTQLVGGVLAATKAAGTARITFSAVSTSADPVLRGSSTGRGVVDFRTGSVRVTEASISSQSSSTDGGPVHTSLSRDVEETVDIGQSSYQRDFGSWSKSPRSTIGGDPLGLQDAVGPFPFGEIGAGTRIAHLRDLGPASVGGVATTRYLVTASVPPSCQAALRAATAAGTYMGPTTLWVDHQGRLVQTRSALHFNLSSLKSLLEKAQKLEAKSQKAFEKGTPRALQNQLPGQSPTLTFPSGAEVIVSTLHLGDFGAPVRITAPAVTQQSHSFSLFQVGVKGVGRTTGTTQTCGSSQSVGASRVLDSVSGVSSSVGSSSSGP